MRQHDGARAYRLGPYQRGIDTDGCIRVRANRRGSNEREIADDIGFHPRRHPERSYILMSFTITRGDTRTLATTVYTDSTLVTPKNLATATAIKFTARRGTAAGTQVFQKTLAAGDIRIIVAANGTLEIDLVPADTSSLPSARTILAYDLEITWTGGAVNTVETGTLYVEPDVTT